MDTWLEEEDVARLFKIVNGELSEDFTTYDEVVEFKRLVDQAIVNKPKLCYSSKESLQ